MYVDIVDQRSRRTTDRNPVGHDPIKAWRTRWHTRIGFWKDMETPVMPGPMLRQSFVFDLPPGEFLGTSWPVNPSTESQDYEMPFRWRVQERHGEAEYWAWR
jgi:hypothetical protein